MTHPSSPGQNQLADTIKAHQWYSLTGSRQAGFTAATSTHSLPPTKQHAPSTALHERQMQQSCRAKQCGDHTYPVCTFPQGNKRRHTRNLAQPAPTHHAPGSTLQRMQSRAQQLATAHMHSNPAIRCPAIRSTAEQKASDKALQNMQCLAMQHTQAKCTRHAGHNHLSMRALWSPIQIADK